MIEGKYDKTHLLPFGEYVPLPGILGFISRLAHGEGDFTAGEYIEPLRLDNIALGMLICYEVIFPEETQKRVAAGANLLVNISNDAWFGRTSAPAQHLNLSVLRSIEQGRCLVRATNTGISAFVDPKGRMIVGSGLFRAQALGAEVGLTDSVTVYHRIAGFIIPGLALILGLLAATAFVSPRSGYQPPRSGSL